MESKFCIANLKLNISTECLKLVYILNNLVPRYLVEYLCSVCRIMYQLY